MNWQRQAEIDTQGQTHQVFENAVVQLPFCRPALPHLLVVVLQALPVGPERIKTVCIDILDPAQYHMSVLP